jgi:hypothetical protein
VTDTKPPADEEDLVAVAGERETLELFLEYHRTALSGKPREEITGNARGDDPSWDVGGDKTIATVIAEFDSACAASRQIAAAFTLDQTVPHDENWRLNSFAP